MSAPWAGICATIPGLGGTAFRTFGAAHLATLAVIVAVAIAMPLWARRRLTTSAARRKAGWTLAAVLVFNELIYYVWTVLIYGVATFAESYLPLHLCGLTLYLLAWLFTRGGRFAYETAYYWGLAGTLQATLTPNLQAGFPSYHFIQYFITHGGIVIAVSYATWGLGWRPTKGSVWRTMVASNVCLFVMAGINGSLRAAGLTEANYMFVCGRPEGASPFFFLLWPWYLAFLELVALVFFWLLYLPWKLAGDRGDGGPSDHRLI